MGLKPLRECKQIGCHELTRSTYCETHLKCENERLKRYKNERQKRYDEKQRDKRAAAFYKTQAWKDARALSMAKHYGLCQDCLAKGIVKQADMVHHIKALRDYPELALTQSNLRPLCNKCHAQYK